MQGFLCDFMTSVAIAGAGLFFGWVAVMVYREHRHG